MVFDPSYKNKDRRELIDHKNASLALGFNPRHVAHVGMAL